MTFKFFIPCFVLLASIYVACADSGVDTNQTNTDKNIDADVDDVSESDVDESDVDNDLESDAESSDDDDSESNVESNADDDLESNSESSQDSEEENNSDDDVNSEEENNADDDSESDSESPQESDAKSSDDDSESDSESPEDTVNNSDSTQEGPCDIYANAGQPCVAAYSMVRRLLSTYTGPLYQVRSESSAQNTGSGGTTHDIGMTADGFGDAAAQDAICEGTVCTVSLLYDQSGNENHLPVAKGGRSDGGQYAAMDDFETIANTGELTVGGHRVYSLYMEARQGYRLTRAGNNVPLHQEPQGIYMLADGTHYGTACCWDFGNVSPDPTRYGVMNTLFFGTAYWGKGASNGPWFMADFEAGVWAGGSSPTDPGWGALDTTAPPNQDNPSLGVPFALGYLKTDQSNYALRMADLQTATDLTTAYAGGLPKQMANEGAIVLGVGGDNSNNSWGTFFEGAVVAGFPSDQTELAVMENIQAVGYGQ